MDQPTARPVLSSVINGLTYVQHLPTPFISTFMLIHLAAPALATIGGTESASQVMLLGREYYHGIPQETLLVYAPIVVHVGASLVKRGAKLVRTATTQLPSNTSKQAGALVNPSATNPYEVLIWTGYPLILYLSVHINTHRLIPSNPSPPISAISPSELDFSFVAFGLRNWPVRSWALYSTLVGAGITHVVYGMPIVWRQTVLKIFKRARIVHSESKLWLSWRAMPKVGLIGIGVVLLGLLRISREDIFISRLANVRMLSAYRMSALYR